MVKGADDWLLLAPLHSQMALSGSMEAVNMQVQEAQTGV